MKKVIGMLMVVAFASSMAGAELLKNFKYIGIIDVKSTSGEKSITPAKASFGNVNSRVILGINFDLNDAVNARVTAVKSDYRYFGNNSTGQTLDTLTNLISFPEAYLNLKNVLGIDHKLGKQFYGTPGDIVIYYGPSYSPSGAVVNFSVSSLDGWHGKWAKNKWTVTGLAAKVTENSLISPRDKNLYGVTGSYAYSNIVRSTIYVYQSDDRNNAAYGNNLLAVAGVKAEGKYQGVGYGAEYAINTGKDKPNTKNYKGSALKVNAGYGLDIKAAGKLGFVGEFAMGSGNKAAASATKNEEFTAISHNYLPGLIFGNFGVGAANNGLGNLTTYNAGIKFMPAKVEKLSLAGTFYNFAYTEKVGAVDAIGSEFDFTTAWKHSENVSLKASYAMFTPNAEFADKDAETLVGLDLAVKF